MNKLDLLIYTYSNLHNYKNIPFWVLTPFRRLVRIIANNQLPKHLSKEKKHLHKKQTDVIVSFTSFPARIDNVWQVVECMFRQTYQPKKILLWLSKEQFYSKNNLPKSLLERENDIFEIRIVPEDIRSHKKYYYASIEYPDSLILLIDDDIYYPTDMIEKMLNEYNSHCESIIARYGSIIRYDVYGNMIPHHYGWMETYSSSTDKKFFFGSGGGFLFKPNKLFKDLTNKDLFLKLTPTADDIWLNSMVRLAELPIRKIKFGIILPINQGKNNQSLCEVNIGNGEDDIQIKNIILYYKKLLGVKLFDKTEN